LARYSAIVNLPAVAASKMAGKFIAFTAMKVKSIRGAVNIAGTADAAAYDVYNGTTSVGTIVMGTSTAGAAKAYSTSDITLAAGGFIDFRTIAASATMAASMILEYELVPGADLTV
jgi:hypothetical protein